VVPRRCTSAVGPINAANPGPQVPHPPFGAEARQLGLGGFPCVPGRQQLTERATDVVQRPLGLCQLTAQLVALADQGSAQLGPASSQEG
jgi:hypothetical protein